VTAKINFLAASEFQSDLPKQSADRITFVQVAGASVLSSRYASPDFERVTQSVYMLLRFMAL
jgi:hypothetical protein